MKNAVRYVVTVKAIVEDVRKVGKEWAKVSDDPKQSYGYTPEIEKTVRTEMVVFEQAFDTLDLAGVVAVANGLVKA